MTVIPVSMLSPADLQHLGFNLQPDEAYHPSQAVNRSLAIHEEQLSDEDFKAIEAACGDDHTAA